MTKKVYQLETLVCPSCVRKIEGALSRMDGIDQVEVLFNASKVKVSFDETAVSGAGIRRTIENLGYDVLNEK